jgi:hypothetical protein
MPSDTLQAAPAQGVASSAELQSDLKVSQPTASRAGRAGAGLVRRWGLAAVLPRAVPVGAQVPIVRIDTPFGQLTPLQSGAVWVDEVWPARWNSQRAAVFCFDMRPQGFTPYVCCRRHP